jgi:GNAT superfamily N-acetyltransferase
MGSCSKVDESILIVHNATHKHLRIAGKAALNERYQQHLVDALIARTECAEAASASHFGFEILRYGPTTLIRARSWPDAPDQLPFARVFHYEAPATAPPDPILARCTADGIDAIFEVLPGSHSARTSEYLRRHNFTPTWEIPWLDIQIEQFSATGETQHTIYQVARHEMEQLADLFVEGYGYSGAQAAFWHAFARYGYTAPDFHCFVAEFQQQPAAFGIVHIKENIALVDGAATLPRYRGLGLQKALLTARIQYARERGCTYAFSRTGRGSISQRNLETVGMRVVCHSTAWRLDRQP